jgi:hypothetical protein
MYKNTRPKPVYNTGMAGTGEMSPGTKEKRRKSVNKVKHTNRLEITTMRTAREKRAKIAHVKKLKARAEAQAFNQSIWPTVAYRHGTKQMSDTPYKDMIGKRREEIGDNE